MFIHGECSACGLPANVSDDSGICGECIGRALMGLDEPWKLVGVGDYWADYEDALEAAGVV